MARAVRSLTDETKELVMMMMGEGKPINKKEVTDFVAKNISRPEEFRPNVLAGALKVLIETGVLNVVERGKYMLAPERPRLTKKEMVTNHLSICIGNIRKYCELDIMDVAEGELAEVKTICELVKELETCKAKFISEEPVKPEEPQPTPVKPEKQEPKELPQQKDHGEPKKEEVKKEIPRVMAEQPNKQETKEPEQPKKEEPKKIGVNKPEQKTLKGEKGAK